MYATVLVACRNGERYLADTLQAVLAQGFDRPWEIVLADNGSTDGSRRIFEDFAARHPARIMRVVDASQRPGKSHALNLGVAAAAGRAIVLCDADDVPAPGWLAAMGAALERHDFVSACMELDRLNDGPAGCYRPVPSNTWRLPFAPFSLCTAGATMGFTRRLFDAVGGFSVEFQPEDDEFCIRADLAGFRLQVVPEAVVHYRLRRDPAAIFRQAYQYSRCDVQIAKRYRGYGPAQRMPWRRLGREMRSVARLWLRLRLASGPRDPAHEAQLSWRMGAVAGQLAGVLHHRAPPSRGLPPPEPARPVHEGAAARTA